MCSLSHTHEHGHTRTLTQPLFDFSHSFICTRHDKWPGLHSPIRLNWQTKCCGTSRTTPMAFFGTIINHSLRRLVLPSLDGSPPFKVLQVCPCSSHCCCCRDGARGFSWGTHPSFVVALKTVCFSQSLFARHEPLSPNTNTCQLCLLALAYPCSHLLPFCPSSSTLFLNRHRQDYCRGSDWVWLCPPVSQHLPQHQGPGDGL